MALDFTKHQAEQYPELKEKYDEFAELYKKKLWHQLTISLNKFILDPSNWRDKEKNLVALYDNFILSVKDKLNELKLIQIVSVISQQFVSTGEISAAIEFVNKNLDKELPIAATIVGRMCIAELNLFDNNQQECEDIIESVRKSSLTQVYGTNDQNVAYSAFYRVTTAFYKLVGPAEEFYTNAIQFLAYTPLDSIDKDKQVALAKDVCFAALVGANVFNFGEIIPQKILSVLEGTEDAWLLRLLDSFHEGNIDDFAKIFETHEKMFQEYKVLGNNIEILRQKIGLMCLLKMIFEKGGESRTIDIDEIARRVKIDSKMAEWLLMRAMAKGLIKGKIDGVKRKVTVSWLKPRVMTTDQLGVMCEKLGLWRQKVENTSNVLVEETAELYA